MSKIKVLNEHLTNMIAAGEVVERPMGVIKELAENSIDAGSTHIEIRLKNGGLDGIEISDNGCGMDKVDATAAFNRHATSKIFRDDDLWHIHTMGFRGEALPSIASVSKLAMTTCDGQDSTSVRIEYGQIKEVKPFACPKGTKITVEGLFYKTPARLKHLKNANSEMNTILDLVQKLALAHPEIAFELYNDDKLKLQTNGSKALQETIMAVYGLEVAKKAIKIECSDYDFHIEGYVIAPAITRSSKQYINTFINGRVIRNYFLNKAITEAYSQFIMPERYPIVVLNIQVDYQLVDVNVHPSKWEIRLSKEKQLAQLLKDNIRTVIRNSMIPSDLLIDHLATAEKITEVVKDRRSESEKPTMQTTLKTVQDIQQQYFCEKENIDQPIKGFTQEKLLDYQSNPTIERFTFLAQLHGRYILAYDEENLYIIDQHAAQERCMYEDIQNRIMEKTIVMQPLLVPLVIEVTPAIVSQIELLNEQLSCIGLYFEQFSLNSLIIREVPDFFQDIDETDFVNKLINEVINDKQMNVLEVRKEKIASLACHSSVRFNHYLSTAESKKLLNRLGNCKQPFNCPHGRPTMITISEKQLVKEFKRV
ncbi:MAG: DNA mismatch repair endonuclease MutL [Erysipelotrichia bacterium]|nr:DNA mismatch repair endonuclease MutL [Erysipelotrichia bacterium]